MADKINQGATEKVQGGTKALNQGAWQNTSEPEEEEGLSIPIAMHHYKQMRGN